MSAGPEDGMVGARLARRFLVIERIAKGGMGTVYRARDERLDRDVVIKVPAAHLIEDDAGRARFGREIEALRTIEHPHVVPILDAGEHEGTPWYALRYMRGGSLRDRLPHPATRDALRWLAQVGSALDYCHGRGFIHRDVKPGNVLFDEHGVAYLTDFGVAQIATSGDAARLTQTGLMPGSPAYMAPEQAFGGEVEPGSDQYALAVSAYEALAGSLPFEAENPVQLAVEKRRGTHAPLHTTAARVPAGASEAIERALQPSPERRFQSCMALANAVAAGLKQPRGAAQAAAGTRAHRNGHGTRARRIAGVAVVLALALGLASWALGDREPSTPTRERTRPSADRSAVWVIEVEEPADGTTTRLPSGGLRGFVTGAEGGHVELGATRAPVSSSGTFELPLVGLSDGKHTLELGYVPAGEAAPVAIATHSFVLDRSPPRLQIDELDARQIGTEAAALRGSVHDRTRVDVTLNGVPVSLADDGRFEHGIRLDETEYVIVIARDEAGNETRWERSLPKEPALVLEAPPKHAHASFDLPLRVVYRHMPIGTKLSVAVKGVRLAGTEALERDLGATKTHAGEVRTLLTVRPPGGACQISAFAHGVDGANIALAQRSMFFDGAKPELLGGGVTLKPPEADMPFWSVHGRLYDVSSVEASYQDGEARTERIENGRFVLPLTTPPSEEGLRIGFRDQVGHVTSVRATPPAADERPPSTPAAAIRTGQASENHAGYFGVGASHYAFRLQAHRQRLPGDFTIECWARSVSRKPEQALLANFADTGVLLTHAESAVFAIGAQQGPSITSRTRGAASPGPGAWHHYAATFLTDPKIPAQGTMEWFVDGVSQGTRVTPQPGRHGRAWVIGGRYSARPPRTMDHFQGWIDDVRISNKVRYRGRFTPPGPHTFDAHTTALIDFDHVWRGLPLVLAPQPYPVRQTLAPRIDAIRHPAHARAEAERQPVPEPPAFMRFDGKSAITVPLAERKQYTVECWVRSRQAEGREQGLLSRLTDGGYGLLWGPVPGGFGPVGRHGKDGDWGDRGLRGPSVSANTWTHVAQVFDGTEARLYVNGELHQLVRPTEARKPGAASLAIGASWARRDGEWVATRGFLGDIYDVRISEGARYAGDFTPEQRLARDEATHYLMQLDAHADSWLYPNDVRRMSAPADMKTVVWGTPRLVRADAEDALESLGGYLSYEVPVDAVVKRDQGDWSLSLELRDIRIPRQTQLVTFMGVVVHAHVDAASGDVMLVFNAAGEHWESVRVRGDRWQHLQLEMRAGVVSVRWNGARVKLKRGTNLSTLKIDTQEETHAPLTVGPHMEGGAVAPEGAAVVLRNLHLIRGTARKIKPRRGNSTIIFEPLRSFQTSASMKGLWAGPVDGDR